MASSSELSSGTKSQGSLAAFFRQADDHVDHGLERLVAGHHRAEHDLFGQLLGFRFHHHHGVAGAGNHEVKLGVVHFSDGRVDNVGAILVAHARSADRTQEGQAGQDQRGRRTDHGDDIRIVLHVVRQHGQHDLRVVLEAFGEERADRPVDETRGQRLLVGRTAFAFEKATRDLAGGEVFFPGSLRSAGRNPFLP